MKLRFKQEVEIQIVTSFDEGTETVNAENEVFMAGEEVEFDLLEQRANDIDIQFGDGSCTYGLSIDLFELTEDLDSEWIYS